MPVFSYAFIQKNNKLYSLLKRSDNGQPFFDMVLFNEDNYLCVDEKNLWGKWKQETSFCSSIDTVDFVFIIPETSLLKIPKGNVTIKNGWNKETITKLMNKVIGNERISGDIDKEFTIESTPYSVIRYSSDSLPDNKS